jgi:hypothetical protein
MAKHRKPQHFKNIGNKKLVRNSINNKKHNPERLQTSDESGYNDASKPKIEKKWEKNHSIGSLIINSILAIATLIAVGISI